MSDIRLPGLPRVKHGDAFVLGATRVVLCFIFLMTPERSEALTIASFSHATFSPPAGLAWFVAHVPIDASTVALAGRVYLAAALFGLVGLYTRVALSALLVSATYLFAVRQLAGAVFHDMHLLWFLAVLVASPASKALSVDTLMFREKSGSADWRASHLDGDASSALFWIRTLLGLIYFFPGFWKLRESGLSWALSANLENQIHAKWFQHQIIPVWRIDLHPTLLKLAGLGTLLFEIGFGFAVHIGTRTRIALAALGILFHLSIERFMLIPFSSLWCCYIALLPAPFRTPPGSAIQPVRRFGVHIVGAILAACLVERGVSGITQSFPFACYPTFQWIIGPTLPDLIATQDGRPLRIARDAQGKRSQTEWGEVWSVAGIYGAPFSESRLRAFLKRSLPGTTGLVDVEIGYFNTAPEAWGEPPVRRVPLRSIYLP